MSARNFTVRDTRRRKILVNLTVAAYLGALIFAASMTFFQRGISRGDMGAEEIPPASRPRDRRPRPRGDCITSGIFMILRISS